MTSHTVRFQKSFTFAFLLKSKPHSDSSSEMLQRMEREQIAGIIQQANSLQP